MSTDNFTCSVSPTAQHGELICKNCFKSFKSFRVSKVEKPNRPKKRAKVLLFFQLTKYYDIFFAKFFWMPLFPWIFVALLAQIQRLANLLFAHLWF